MEPEPIKNLGKLSGISESGGSRSLLRLLVSLQSEEEADE
jgi:hypothetical protein